MILVPEESSKQGKGPQIQAQEEALAQQMKQGLFLISKIFSLYLF